MGLCTGQAGVGNVAASEADLMLRPARGFQVGARRGAIYAHQGTGSALSPIDATNFAGTLKLVQAIAAAGYPVAAQDLGGANPWGNTTAQTRVGSTDAWLISSTGVGASSSARVGVGISMGAAALVNYFGKSPGHVSDIAAFVFVLPVWDLDRLYQGDVSSTRAGIQTAWGVTYPTSLPAGANPKDNTSLLSGKPVRIYYASDDSICDATQAGLMVSAFGANASSVSLGALGHTDAAAAAVDTSDVVSWLATVAAR